MPNLWARANPTAVCGAMLAALFALAAPAGEQSPTSSSRTDAIVAILKAPPAKFSTPQQARLLAAFRPLAETVARSAPGLTGAKVALRVCVEQAPSGRAVVFRASAESSQANPASRSALTIEVVAAPPKASQARFDQWFEPFDLEDSYIRAGRFVGDRAALSKLFGPGSETVSWQKGAVLVQFRQPGKVRQAAAQLVHQTAEREGLYRFGAEVARATTSAQAATAATSAQADHVVKPVAAPPAPAAQPQQQAPVARVTLVSGDVKLTRGNGQPTPLKTGDTLNQGDRIETGADGIVGVERTATDGNGSTQATDVIEYGGNTKATITQAGSVQTPLVISIDGVADWSHNPKFSGPEPDTLLGQALVQFHGTHVLIAARSRLYADIRVVQGSVTVTSRAQPTKNVRVNAGQRLHVQAKGAIGQPVPMRNDEASQFAQALHNPNATIDSDFGRWVRHRIANQGCWLDLPWNWHESPAGAQLASLYTPTAIDPKSHDSMRVYVRVLRADPSVHIRTETERFLAKASAGRPDLKVVEKRGDVLAGQRAAWTVVKMNQPGGSGKLYIASWMLRDNDRLLVVSAQANENTYLLHADELRQILSTFRLDKAHQAAAPKQSLTH